MAVPESKRSETPRIEFREYRHEDAQGFLDNDQIAT